MTEKRLLAAASLLAVLLIGVFLSVVRYYLGMPPPIYIPSLPLLARPLDAALERVKSSNYYSAKQMLVLIYQMSPLEFEWLGGGSCADFAVYAAYQFKAAGLRYYLIVTRTHVMVYSPDARALVDNYRVYGFKSLEGAVAYTRRTYGEPYIVDAENAKVYRMLDGRLLEDASATLFYRLGMPAAVIVYYKLHLSALLLIAWLYAEWVLERPLPRMRRFCTRAALAVAAYGFLAGLF